MKRFLVLLLMLAVVASAALGGCSNPQSGDGKQQSGANGQAAAANEIKLGVYEPMTGSQAAGGQMTWEGIQLANQLRPKALGKDIKLVLVDNKSDKVEASNAVSRLIDQEKVVAIIGSYGSSNSIAGGAVAEKAKIPVVGDSPTNPLVTEGKKYYIRVCFIDPFQGEVMAKFAVETLKAKTAAIIQDVSQDYSVGLSTYFRNAFIKLTNNPNSIVAFTSYNSGDQDFTAQLTSVAAKKPDVIFSPGYYAEGALLAKQARAMGIKAPLLGGDAWEAPELVQIGGKDVEGLYFSTHYSSEAATRDISKKFVSEYKKKFNKEPNAFAALGFDSYNTIVDAIEKAGKADSEAINANLHAIKDYEAVTGKITIDQNGNARKSAVILQVKDGKFAFIANVEP